MENASKALLIAASILIVILLIAFGVKVFNSTAGASDKVDETMQTTEISTFNSRFTAHIGTNKSKAQVISLLNTVIASNATNEQHQVNVNSGSAQSLMNSLTDKTYTIKIEATDYSGGYIINIQII